MQLCSGINYKGPLVEISLFQSGILVQKMKLDFGLDHQIQTRMGTTPLLNRMFSISVLQNFFSVALCFVTDLHLAYVGMLRILISLKGICMAYLIQWLSLRVYRDFILKLTQ